MVVRAFIAAGAIALALGACAADHPAPRFGPGTPVAGFAGGGVGGAPSAGTGVPPGTGGTSGTGGVPTGGGGAGVAGAPPPELPPFDAGTDPNRNQVAAGALCQRLATIQCAGEEHCCFDPGRSRAACESDVLSTCVNAAFLDAISTNMISGFDAVQAAAVFTNLESLASQCDPTFGSYALSIDGLGGMFRGTKAAGADCGPGLSTDMARIAASLASCIGGATTACLPMNLLTWRCAARGGVGALCATDANCVDGLHCPNTMNEVGTVTCVARKPVGQPCSLPTACESLFCKGGVCVEANQQNVYCLAVDAGR